MDNCYKDTQNNIKDMQNNHKKKHIASKKIEKDCGCTITKRCKTAKGEAKNSTEENDQMESNLICAPHQS